MHPTQKPLSLIEILIRNSSNRANIILDPFAGSGTTAIACIKTGRQFIIIEKDKQLYEIAKMRIKKYLTQKRFFERKKR